MAATTTSHRLIHGIVLTMAVTTIHGVILGAILIIVLVGPAHSVTIGEAPGTTVGV